MAKNRILYAAALVGLLLFYCFYTGWISWFLLMFALLLPVFSLLCSLPVMLRCTVTARLPARCERGEAAVLVLENGTPGALPVPACRLTLACADAIAGETEKTVLRLTAWRRHEFPLDTAHCGAYAYSLERGRIYDYLGLFWLRLRLSGGGTLLVLPREEAPSPIPDLSRFQARAYRPKYGGGFSELHELRPYRPGDSMRDIHWKLSAKTDALVVREAQEPNRGAVVLSLDLDPERAVFDRALDTLRWLSRWLLRHETAHFVCWLRSEDCEICSRRVADEAELSELVEELLTQTPREGAPSLADRPFAHADWHYHIRVPEEEA